MATSRWHMPSCCPVNGLALAAAGAMSKPRESWRDTRLPLSGNELRDQCIVDGARVCLVNRSLKLLDRQCRSGTLYTIYGAGFEPLVVKVDLRRPDLQIRCRSGGIPVVEMLKQPVVIIGGKVGAVITARETGPVMIA